MPQFGQLPPEMVCPPPGPRGRAFVETLASSECPALTTRRARRAEQSGAAADPIVWTRAQNCNVLDVDGNRYVDLSAGFGAAAVGHSHPRVSAAIAQQSETLLHALGDLHPSDVKVQLLDRISRLSPYDDARVILGLHGADAIEAALKTAMLYTGRPGVLAFSGGYHGLSHGPLALCGYNEAFREPFSPQLNPHVTFAAYPGMHESVDTALAEVQRALSDASTPVGAVVIEPLQGRGGVNLLPDGFLRALCDFCSRQGILLVADEIMTGLGRTGGMFECLQQGAVPDLICLGKALGGGLPTSACIGRHGVMAAWGDPDKEALHTATFLGNPLLASAAVASLDVLDDEGLVERAAAVGQRFMVQLRSALGDHSNVVNVRGRGLLVGVGLSRPMMALTLMQRLLERGYITVPAGGGADVLSLTPPLTIDERLLDGFVKVLSHTLAEFP